MSSIAVIIVAGGSGSRMQARQPKQFLPIGGRPILMHTVERFAEALEGCRIVVVLPKTHITHWQSLCKEYGFDRTHTLCEGGQTRFESVRRGLAHIGDAELVAVHDGVRPLVSGDMIRRTVEDARTFGAAIPVVPPVDSLRELDGTASRIVDRSRFRIVQTPQTFRASVIREAYERPYDERFTDDASVVEACGHEIHLCEGAYSNIKITTPVDMAIAEALLKNNASLFSSGNEKE